MLRRIIRRFRRHEPSPLLAYIDEQLRAEGYERNTRARWY